MATINFKSLKKFVVQKIDNELPSYLTYHNLQHTLDVLENCKEYGAELEINKHEQLLLNTAALLHDIGFIWQYKEHEKRSMEFAQEELPKRGYTNEDIEVINRMIRTTKIPQSPETLLEKIICDADLNYLGTDQFYKIGQTLFQEFLSQGYMKDETDWNTAQIEFLKEHKYHTDFAIKHREPTKQKHLAKLISNNSQ